ncbi:MAG: GAF domain-containing protein [Acidobacteria bacterium]|nr:GAF domain-containing protein [Acidobacteriota bacterium]
MSDDLLIFPDVPRVALDLRIAELVEAAEHVLATQDRLRALLSAHQSIAAEHGSVPVLHRIVRTALMLSAAGSGALVVRGPSGDVERVVHADPAAGPLRVDGGGGRRWPTVAPAPRSVLEVPIRVHGVHYGELVLADSVGGGFSVEDEQLVQSLAVTAGFAIESARLYDEMRRGRAWALASADVAARLLDPGTGESVALVADLVLDLADAATASVGLLADDGGSMRVWRLGVDRAVVPPAVRAVTGTLVERVCAGDGPLRVDVPTVADQADSATDGPVLGLPMRVGDRRLGALVLGRTRDRPAFSDADVSMAEGFVARASVALQLRRHSAGMGPGGAPAVDRPVQA